MSASRISNYDDSNDYIDLDRALEQDGRFTPVSSGSRTSLPSRNHRISLHSINDDDLLRLTRSLVTPLPTSRCDMRDENDFNSRYSIRSHGDYGGFAPRINKSPVPGGYDQRCESVMLFRCLNNVGGDADDVSVDLVASDLCDFIDPVMFEGSISRPGSRAPGTSVRTVPSRHSRSSSRTSREDTRSRGEDDRQSYYTTNDDHRHTIPIDIQPEDHDALSFHAQSTNTPLSKDAQRHTDSMNAAFVQSAEKTRQLLMAVEKSFNSELPSRRRARAISNESDSSFRNQNHGLYAAVRDKRLSLDVDSLIALQKDSDVLLERRRSLLKLRTDQLLARHYENEPKQVQESSTKDRLSRQMYNEELRQLKQFASLQQEEKDRFEWKELQDELQHLKEQDESLPDRTVSGSAPPASSRDHHDRIHAREFELPRRHYVQKTTIDPPSQTRRDNLLSAQEGRYSVSYERFPRRQEQTSVYTRQRTISDQYRLDNASTFPCISEEETKSFYSRTASHQNSSTSPTEATLSSSSASTENISVASDDVNYNWAGKTDVRYPTGMKKEYPTVESTVKPQLHTSKELGRNMPSKAEALYPRLRQRRATTTVYHESRMIPSVKLRTRGSAGALVQDDYVDQERGGLAHAQLTRSRLSHGDKIHQNNHASSPSVTESAKQVLANIRQRRRNTIEQVQQNVQFQQPSATTQGLSRSSRLQTLSQRTNENVNRPTLDPKLHTFAEETTRKAGRQAYPTAERGITDRHNQPSIEPRSIAARHTKRLSDINLSHEERVSDHQLFDASSATPLRSSLSRLPQPSAAQQPGTMYRYSRHKLV